MAFFLGLRYIMICDLMLCLSIRGIARRYSRVLNLSQFILNLIQIQQIYFIGAFVKTL